MGAKDPETTVEKRNYKYGFWCAAGTTPAELVAKCNEQLAKCKRWVDNVNELKAENEAKVNAALLASFETKEELEAAIALFNTKLQKL
jgi:methionine aminopeptidase